MTTTTTTTTLRAAIEALEGATEGSHELDCRVFAAVSGWSYPLFGAAVSDFRDTDYTDYTTSLDAALTLVPKDLPLTMTRGADEWWRVRVMLPGSEFDGTKPIAPLALCLAALRAWLKMEEQKP